MTDDIIIAYLMDFYDYSPIEARRLVSMYQDDDDRQVLVDIIELKKERFGLE